MILSSPLKQQPLSPAEAWLIEMCFVLARANKRLNWNKAGASVRWEMEKQSVHPRLPQPRASNPHPVIFPPHLLCLLATPGRGQRPLRQSPAPQCFTPWSTFKLNKGLFLGKEAMSSIPSKRGYKVLGALNLNCSFILKVIWIRSTNYQENLQKNDTDFFSLSPKDCLEEGRVWDSPNVMCIIFPLQNTPGKVQDVPVLWLFIHLLNP